MAAHYTCVHQGGQEVVELCAITQPLPACPAVQLVHSNRSVHTAEHVGQPRGR